MEKSIAIIGAGIAGLAAGCYAQMNGYRSEIYELHNLPGGLCTAWERGPYVFDGCIHYLLGSGEGQPFNRLWQELGALRGRKIIDHEEMMRITGPDGQTLILYADPDRLEAHMRELSPADAGLIGALCQGVRHFTHFDMSLLQQKPRSLMGLRDWAALGLKMMPFTGALARWALVSAGDFGSRFKDPFLRRAVPQIFAWPDIPMMAGLSLLAYTHTHNAGFPTGASLEFARAVERRYLELGGQIHYRAQVEKILTEDARDGRGKRAAAVRLYSDEVCPADYVISAADGRTTIFDMLDGEFVSGRIKNYYDGRLPVHSQVQVSLGVNRDLSAEPHWVTYLLDRPIMIAGEGRYEVGVKNYCFDPSLAPAGKSVLIAMLNTHYSYWQHIYGHRLYDSEQSQVSQVLLDFLERIYPGLRRDTEVVDEATPLSYERYTGNWLGSSCGWLLTKQTMPLMLLGMPKTLPGLRDFYMAGQWVEPGGMLPISAMSGRNAIQAICHQDGKRFGTTVGESPARTM